MACIITYENKQYTQKEFEQYFKEHFTEFVDNFLGSKQDIEKFKEFVEQPLTSYDIQYQLPQGREMEEFVASEKTIRDLAARMSDRIGIPVKFESDRSKEYKGKLENGVAVINLAFADLSTPIHEILGHPIIRALKNKKLITSSKEITQEEFLKQIQNAEKWSDFEWRTENKAYKILDEGTPNEMFIEDTIANKELYQNLLKELEYGKGAEVLDRIKRDYNSKQPLIDYSDIREQTSGELKGKFVIYDNGSYLGKENTLESAKQYVDEINEKRKYSLEEHQEEAVVELLSLMVAEKLDKVKDGKLISLLKRLLKEMKQFVRSLINQKEIEIGNLPDNLKINDLANILAYSNSKLILPGYTIEYTSPDNIKFKTYQEASNHVGELAKSVDDVDLDSINVNRDTNDYTVNNIEDVKRLLNSELDFPRTFNNVTYYKEEGVFMNTTSNPRDRKEVSDDEVIEKFNVVLDGYKKRGIKNPIENFIEKNKEYEHSKEIIEEWKKVNNIQYNPEEIYSRGQEFSSVVGAYSSFDVNLMMQNLLSHIEDNEKAGGKFAISAYTKPIDKTIGHLEGGGGKIKFKINPKSEDILWAANTDVYSGSVWDASEKVNKDKKSELLGVSYTKYPSLSNVNSIQPNLAAIVDDLNHHHNELGIVLTGNNFRLEYDEDIPYTTKKIIDGINKILDQKYGKLVKSEINVKNREGFKVYFTDAYGNSAFSNPNFNTREEAQAFIDEKKDTNISFKIVPNKGIQPTTTNETLKESISDVRNKLGLTKNKAYFRHDEFYIGDIVIVKGYKGKYKIYELERTEGEIGVPISEIFFNLEPLENEFDPEINPDGLHPLFNVPTSKLELYKDPNKKEKEYTEQALINTKIAKLKEVAKKYPRSLIRSEVKRINTSSSQELYDQFGADELPFQKIRSNSIIIKEKEVPLLENTKEENEFIDFGKSCIL